MTLRVVEPEKKTALSESVHCNSTTLKVIRNYNNRIKIGNNRKRSIMFHNHKWEDVSCTYTPGVEKMEGDGITIDFAQKAIFGITTIVQKCIKCGKISSHSFVGKGLLQ